MQIIRNGDGYAVHKYRIDGCKSRFSVWYTRDLFVGDMERIDRLGRAYPATDAQREYAFRHRPAAFAQPALINI